MKCNINIGIRCLLLLLGFLAGLPVYSVEPQSFVLSADILYNDPHDFLGDRYSSKFGAGVSLEYVYNKHFGFLSSGHFVRFTRNNRKNADILFYNITVDGLIKYPFTSKFSIFGAAGLGLYLWDSENAFWIDGRSKQASDLGYNYGFGMRYKITEKMSAELKYFHHDVELDETENNSTWNEYGLGLRYLF
ncbi:porin family protein [bacterium]|nr:porin family protein [candidate division CSSED10-310 bacterium]